MRSLAVAAVARVRQQAQVGVMGDAFADEAFCRALVDAIGKKVELKTTAGSLRFRPTSSFATLAGDDLDTVPVARPQAQSSNTIVTFGNRLFLKGYRRLREGANPEFEVGRFLTEVAHFKNCVPVAGVLEHVGANGTTSTLALLQAHVPNQGDGWAYTLEYLHRHLDLRRDSAAPMPPDVHGVYLELAGTLGRRSAEMHLAFADARGEPGFEPEPMTAEDVAAYRARAAADLESTLQALREAQPRMSDAALSDALAVLEARERLLHRIESAIGPDPGARKTRIHGDYHLGQVLLVKNDFVIIDFEGEPGRSFEERRARQSPLRDVAGMLRSFSYARASALSAFAQNQEELAFLAPYAEEWERETRAAFLDGYWLAMGEADGGKAPGDTVDLLSLFELEKALYEVRYELGSRPEWVRIPLRGIMRWLDR